MVLNEGRVRLALATLTAGLVLAAVVLTAVAPAYGTGNPPQVECESDQWNGEYWKQEIENGSLAHVETNIASNAILITSFDGTTVEWTNNADSSVVFRIVRKSGQTISSNIEGAWEPGVSDSFTVPEDISHITFCFTEPEGTTTSTASTTSTTAGETTTTTEHSTTTTAGETTTTEKPTTTTTAGETTTTEKPTTTTTAGETTTTEHSTTTTAGETTTTAGEATTTSTSEATTTRPTDSVSPTSIVNTTAADVSVETLPFTGADSGPVAALALLLVAAGALALVGARVFRAGTDE